MCARYARGDMLCKGSDTCSDSISKCLVECVPLPALGPPLWLKVCVLAFVGWQGILGHRAFGGSVLRQPRTVLLGVPTHDRITRMLRSAWVFKRV